MLDLEVIGEGMTTKVYRDGNKAIKVYINAPFDEAENEAERQRFAYNAGLPVPAVYDVRYLDNNMVALDMEYINGKPLFRQGMDKDERNAAILSLVKLQCDVHNVKAVNQPKQSERIKWRIENTQYLDDKTKEKLLELHYHLDTDDDYLCHGDFHPLNILNDGNKLWIIDWVDATSGNYLADACWTYLIFKQYITRCAGVYLSIFCKEAKVKKEDVLTWLLIVTASRLHENIDEKSKEWLIDIVKAGI